VFHENPPRVATDPLVSLSIPTEALRPLIESVLESAGSVPGWPTGRLALQENEAAECIGVKGHVLRDARRRLKLPHTLVGRTITYTAEQLCAALKQMTANSEIA